MTEKILVELNGFNSICFLYIGYDIRGKKILAYGEKTYVCDLRFLQIKKKIVKDARLISNE